MKPDRWIKIEELCQNALNMAEEDRPAYLKQACEGDDELLSDIESLLDQQREEFLEVPIVTVRTTSVFEDKDQPVDRFIGPYRLIREIASGGMGQVFLAVRSDDAFDRHVALKVVRKEITGADALDRFYSERQILASLNHPNIARLFDGGATEEGLPWFAMEYVEGMPVTEYCDRHGYSADDRLKLFLKICSAVQYAHQNLIVHHDLKPGNILVTADGTPKLLDFGISKILAQEQDTVQSSIQQQIMTPEYASPEQVQGKPASTAGDIYSLGVLVYELLTGSLPIHVQERTPEGVKQAISGVEPEKPSAVAGSRVPSGDLDSIILKALEKKTSDRYSSVEQMAGDIRRYRTHYPVSAHRGSILYRAQKYVRRNRWGVAAATFFTLLVVGFGVLSIMQSAEIQAQAVEAEQQRDRAEKVSQFLIDLFSSADPSEARDESITAIELLRRGAERVEAEMSDEQLLQAELYMVIADVYESLGLYPEAEELARKALVKRTDYYGSEDLQIAAVLNTLGWLHHRQGDPVSADSLLQVALAMRENLTGPYSLDVARTLNDLAVVKQSLADYPATDSLLKRALEIRREQLGPDHEAVGVSLNNYAALKWRMGEFDEAAELFGEVLSILQGRFGQEDLRVANAMTNLAAVQLTRRDLEAAEPLYRQALAIRHQLVGEEHPDVAFSLAHLGNLLRMKGDVEEAEMLLKEALEQRRKLLGTDHILVGDSKRTLGMLFTETGDYDQALHHYTNALRVFEGLLPPGHTRIGDLNHLKGELYLKMGQPELADPVLRRAIEIRTSDYGDADQRTIDTKIQLATALIALNQTDEAKLLLLESAEYLRQAADAPAELIETAGRLLAELE